MKTDIPENADEFTPWPEFKKSEELRIPSTPNIEEPKVSKEPEPNIFYRKPKHSRVP